MSGLIRPQHQKFWEDVYLAAAANHEHERCAAHASSAVKALCKFLEDRGPEAGPRVITCKVGPVAPGQTDAAHWDCNDGYFWLTNVLPVDGAVIVSVSCGVEIVHKEHDSLVRASMTQPGVRLTVLLRNDSDVERVLEMQLGGLFRPFQHEPGTGLMEPWST